MTGAHTDLGQTVAAALALQGASLLLCAHNEHLLTDLYDSLISQDCPEPLLVAMDYQQAEAKHFDHLTAQLEGAVGSVHGIIHMDIPATPLSPISLLTTETWQVSQRQLLWQPLQLIRTMLPLLQAADNPSVVLLSLPCGREGKAYWGALGCALAGLENLCQTLANEHPNVRFNTLDIGPVDFNLRRQFYPAEDRSGLKPINDPSVVGGFLYLASGVKAVQSGQAYQLI